MGAHDGFIQPIIVSTKKIMLKTIGVFFLLKAIDFFSFL